MYLLCRGPFSRILGQAALNKIVEWVVQSLKVGLPMRDAFQDRRYRVLAEGVVGRWRHRR